MSYRERRLRKAERLRDWADGRDVKATDARAAADQISGMIPFGQPILVGHHSEGRHRRDLGRIEGGMRASFEHADKAEEMRSRADTIEAQANRAIYRDDPDEVERLEEKLAGLEAKREQMKEANKVYRREHRAELKAMGAYERHQAVPFPSYSIQNLGGQITNTRKRLDEAKRRRAALEDGGSRGFGREMFSRFSSSFGECGETIDKGEEITYYRLTREALHRRCA